MTVRDTSAIQDHKNELSGMNLTASERIIRLLTVFGPMTRRQIATKLDMETATCSGRVRPLVASGKLREITQTVCPISGNKAYLVSV